MKSSNEFIGLNRKAASAAAVRDPLTYPSDAELREIVSTGFALMDLGTNSRSIRCVKAVLRSH
jgi:hypothetical protein